MGIDPSAMVALIDELEGAGLAERRRRPNNRRAWEVTITPRGRSTLKKARGVASDVEDELLSGLGAADRELLMTLLRRALASVPPQPPWRAEEEG